MKVDRDRRPGPFRRRLATVVAGIVAAGLTIGLVPTSAFADTGVTITVVNGDEQSQYAGHVFAVSLQVLVQDNGPVANAPVVFAVTSGAANFNGTSSTAQTTTNSTGQAFSPPVTAGDSPGPVVITATSSLAPDASAQFQLTVQPQQPATVVVTDGGGQSANVGAQFAQPVSVVVTDSFGDPVPDWPLTFTLAGAPDGNASFPGDSASAHATTDATGGATSPPITATAVGEVSLTVTTGITGVANAVLLGVNPSPPASMSIIGGNNQTTVAGSAFANPLVVRVLDGNGQPPQEPVTVTFSVTSGDATFPGGAFTAPVTLTDATATAPALTAAPSTAGAVSVRASVEDTAVTPVTPVDFNLSVTAVAPNQITAVSGAGQSAYTSTTFANPLVAHVVDQNGNPLAGAYVSFAVTGPASFAGLPTLTVATDEDGNATTAALAAGSTGGAVQVSATIAGLTAGFVETVLARAATSVQPLSGNSQTVAPGHAFASPLVALVLDQTNTAYPGAPVTFTITGLATFDGQPSAIVTTGANGQAQAPTLIAGSTTGTVTVAVTVAGATSLAGFVLTVGYPSQISTSSAHPGDTVHISATGLVPGETVEAWLHSDPVRLLSSFAGSDGRFDADVVIPPGTEPGRHQIEIRAVQSGSTFHDVAINPTLAYTGTPVDPVWLVVIGLATLAAGTLLTFAAHSSPHRLERDVSSQLDRLSDGKERPDTALGRRLLQTPRTGQAAHQLDAAMCAHSDVTVPGSGLLARDAAHPNLHAAVVDPYRDVDVSSVVPQAQPDKFADDDRRRVDERGREPGLGARGAHPESSQLGCGR